MPTEPIPNPKPRQPADPAFPLGVPREIGQYQIQRLLGSGGMATVYAALQKQPRRTVALKVMKAGIAQSRGEAALRRFKREIEILGKLHHPYIAAVYDAGTFDDGTGAAPYFVMEYIPGATNILEFVGKKDMNLRDRLKLFVKVCAAVEHGHGNKVIHRDLKPGNILIDQYGEPKVIDFGIAHAAEVDSSQQTMTTEAGNLVGTLQYMAPEQVDTRPQDLDGRCDVYALGVLLYKMMTGKPPYDLEALPVFEAIRIIREENPRKPSELNPEVKGDLETVILKAMERDRARRYRNAGSLGRDIVRFLANKPINARPASVTYRTSLFVKRNKVALGVIGVIALVAGAALGYTMWERARLKLRETQGDRALQKQTQDLEAQRAAVEAARIAATQRSSSTDSAEPFTLSQHTGRITQLRFVPVVGGAAHPVLASASYDHQLLLWDVESRRSTQKVVPFDAAIAHIAVSADGSTIAIAAQGEDEPIAIVRCVDGQVVRELKDLGGSVTSLALGPSGEMVAWGSSNLTLNLRATEARGAMARDNPRREPRSMRSAAGAFTAIAFARDDNIMAVGAAGGVVSIWEPRGPSNSTAPAQPGGRTGAPANPQGPKRLTGLKQPVIALSFLEREGKPRMVIALAEDGSAFTFVNDNANWQGTGWRAATKPVVAAAFSGNGSRLAIVTADGVEVWSFDSGNSAPQRVGSIIKTDEAPAAIAIDDAGRLIALGMLNGDVRVVPVNP